MLAPQYIREPLYMGSCRVPARVQRNEYRSGQELMCAGAHAQAW